MWASPLGGKRAGSAGFVQGDAGGKKRNNAVVGGGGRDGWPASGTGGGSGGAGMRWLADSLPCFTVLSEESFPIYRHAYVGPLASQGEVKVSIPLTTTATLPGPATAKSNDTFELRLRSVGTGAPEAPLGGSFELHQNGEMIAHRTTDCGLAIPLDGLSPVRDPQAAHTPAESIPASHATLTVMWGERFSCVPLEGVQL